MKLDFRFARDEDTGALKDLWERGWDSAVPDFWERRVHPGTGRSRIVVAVDRDSGQIVGQLAFIPRRALIDGREHLSFRPFAPILSPDARGTLRSANPFRHPILGMYRYGVDALRREGAALLVGVLDSRWRALAPRFPGIRGCLFPLWSRPLPLEEPFRLPRGHAARRLEEFGAELEPLWVADAALHKCSLVRDPPTLARKYEGGDSVAHAVDGPDDVSGLSVGRMVMEHWLISDILAKDHAAALDATLRAACNFGHELATKHEGKVRGVAVLAVPALRQCLDSLGFRPTSHEIAFAVRVLGDEIDEASAAPENWYIGGWD